MTHVLKIAAVSALAMILAAPASFAQSTLAGTTALNDRLDDIERDINRDMRRAEDESRFGSPEFRPGLSGSASLGYSGQTGNNESQEFNLGTRLRFASGQLIQTIGVAINFADEDGVASKEDVFGVYDANYYLTDQFYVFALGRVESDGLADTAEEFQTDAFIGVGPGYRIINTPDMAWRVQAGIGFSSLENGVGESDEEVGYIASSRFYYAFNENVFATIDTDILKSDTALRINNDLGVNLKMTDTFSTRVSYLTEYNDSRPIRSDNKLGVSLVYGF